MTLPTPLDLAPSPPRLLLERREETAIHGLLNATVALVAQMHISITETVSKIFALIPDTSGPLTPRRGRVTRGMTDGIGQISSLFVGTATTSDTLLHDDL